MATAEQIKSLIRSHFSDNFFPCKQLRNVRQIIEKARDVLPQGILTGEIAI